MSACFVWLSGAWVFRGTRVTVQALFENIDDGATVDDFLSWFLGCRKDGSVSLFKYDLSNDPVSDATQKLQRLGFRRSETDR